VLHHALPCENRVTHMTVFPHRCNGLISSCGPHLLLLFLRFRQNFLGTWSCRTLPRPPAFPCDRVSIHIWNLRVFPTTQRMYAYLKPVSDKKQMIFKICQSPCQPWASSRMFAATKSILLQKQVDRFAAFKLHEHGLNWGTPSEIELMASQTSGFKLALRADWIHA